MCACLQDFGLSKIVEEGHSRVLTLTSQAAAGVVRHCPRWHDKIGCHPFRLPAGFWAEQDRGGGPLERSGTDQPGRRHVLVPAARVL